MLTHLEPKDPKKRKQQKTLQNAVYFDGRRQGRQPLSPSETRDAVRQGHGQLRAPRARPDLSAYARQPALTSLLEATRKSLGKRYCAGQPGSRKVVKGAGKGAGKGLKPGYCWQRRREGFKAKLVPNVTF